MSLLKTVLALWIAINSCLRLTPGGQYESERLKYAQDLIDFDKKWSKMFSDKPQTSDNHEGVSHEEFLGCVSLTAMLLY